MLGNIVKSSIALTIFAAIGSTILPVQAALLVGSGGDNSIKQYDETTGAYIQDFVTSGSGGLSNPQGLAIGPNGDLFVASTSTVKQYNGITGAYIGDFAGSGLSNAQGLSFGTDGSLYVVSSFIPGTEKEVAGPNVVSWNSGVLKYDGTTGALIGNIPTGVTGRNLTATGPQPVDVALGGPNDNIFISSGRARSNSGSIAEYNPTSGQPIFRDYTNIDPSVTSIGPQGLAITDNYLYYTDGSSIGRFDLINNIIDPRFVDGSSGGLSGATDVSIGQNGNLFVSNFSTNSIKQYDSNTGDYLGDFIASGSGGLSRPTYLTTANVPVPEPSSVLGILGFSSLFAGSILRRKVNNRKQLASLQK